MGKRKLDLNKLEMRIFSVFAVLFVISFVVCTFLLSDVNSYIYSGIPNIVLATGFTVTGVTNFFRTRDKFSKFFSIGSIFLLIMSIWSFWERFSIREAIYQVF